MARPSPRPTFTLTSRLAPAEIRKRTNALMKDSKRLRGIGFDDRIELAIGGSEHHFWSPQLVVRVRPDEKGGAVLDARFGPDAYVWALYLLLYGACIVLTFWALLFGLVQWSLGQSPVALLAAPGLGVLAGLVYGASFVGQGLGSEQMYLLRATLVQLADCEATEGEAATKPDDVSP